MHDFWRVAKMPWVLPSASSLQKKKTVYMGASHITYLISHSYKSLQLDPICETLIKPVVLGDAR